MNIHYTAAAAAVLALIIGIICGIIGIARTGMAGPGDSRTVSILTAVIGVALLVAFPFLVGVAAS